MFISNKGRWRNRHIKLSLLMYYRKFIELSLLMYYRKFIELSLLMYYRKFIELSLLMYYRKFIELSSYLFLFYQTFLGVSEWLLFNANSSIFSPIWREKVNFQWDNGRGPLCTRPTYFYGASSLKQQSAVRHVAPLGHIIPVPNQPVFALSS